jgi:putative nucleotidyltransferase with HDIG domain
MGAVADVPPPDPHAADEPREAATEPDAAATEQPVRNRHHNEGHGRRLTAAFEALEGFPVLVESRNRVLRLFESGVVSTGEVVAAVESDVALAIAVMRLANRVKGSLHGRVDSVVKGVEVLSPEAVHAIASRARTFDFFEHTAVWQGIPERFRLHAVATQRAANRLAKEVGYDDPDRLMVTSLMHDIGKLVLVQAYPGYPRQVHGRARTPEERVQRERRELGVDHALVGGVLARRWGFPGSVASIIERHHAEDCEGETALVRLADMLAHHSVGGAVLPAALLSVSRGLGLAVPELRAVMYDLPLTSSEARPRQLDPCPLSAREVQVLRGLAQGKVYKQIAAELGLSTSTVRTHLHNVYGKLGAMDRAQAVLTATERGWI